jgi:CheY-like chemotaxis protein
VKSTLGLRILCVDDDDEIREMLGAIFQGEGYDVSLAATAREALQSLSERHHHLVITDYRLPDDNGAWMLREAAARGLLRDTEALIITAGPTPPDASNVRVYKKPLDVDDFVAKVDLILAPAREAEVDKARRNLATMNQPAARHVSTRRIEFTLYISTASPSSLKALRNLQRLLEEFEPRHVVLNVCDLSREMPPSVDEDRIAFTPTLVKRFPEPRAWILGDLEDSKVVTDLMVHSGVERKK